jgi:hypothetical protein
LNNPELFQKLIPNLHKLDLSNNPIQSIDADVFKYAEKLLELKIDFWDYINYKITNETFRGLVNLRVFNVSLLHLKSFEPFSCLCSLEELIICLKRELSSNRLYAFPSQLSKLRVLKLKFECELEWIAPTAFDHLTCLEWFDFEFIKSYYDKGQETQLIEIGVAPRWLRIVPVDTLRLLGGESSVANIETIGLCESKPVLNRFCTKLECDWPLSGLKKLTAMPLNEKSLSFNQMLNLELLILHVAEFGVLSRSELGCLCKLKELQVHYYDSSL